MGRPIVLTGHLAALSLLGVWGLLELGAAGTLTLAFWFTWAVYAGLLLLLYRGSMIGTWLAIVPPALWAGFSGADILPQVLVALAGGEIGSPASVGAILITVPCGTAAVIHLGYSAGTCVTRSGS